LTEEDKNEIVSLYSQKNIVLEQAAEKPVTLIDVQNKLVELGYGDILGTADGKFGKMTYSAITQALNDKISDAAEIERRNQLKQATDASTSIQTKDVPLVPTPEAQKAQLNITPTLAQLTADIKTKEQADLAITQAKMEAEKAKTQAKLTKEMCRTIGRAVTPLSPFKEGVASQDLCDGLRRCITDGFIVRDETVFEGCNAFPAKQTTPATGTQTTNTTTA
ncbi:hypothetical protein EBU94_04925, partial [bacterium]|nr:hypothetical protein [bacterium]